MTMIISNDAEIYSSVSNALISFGKWAGGIESLKTMISNICKKANITASKDRIQYEMQMAEKNQDDFMKGSL